MNMISSVHNVWVCSTWLSPVYRPVLCSVRQCTGVDPHMVLPALLQYPPADGVSYSGDYLGEPSPKRLCTKPDPSLDHPICPLSYSQANPVYSEASPASASSGSSLNIEDESQRSPFHHSHSPGHMGKRAEEHGGGDLHVWYRCSSRL